MKKQKAFSLGEMSVAIGIIGILLAVSIPVFNNAKPKENVILTRRAYNIVSTTVNELINDLNLYPDEDLGFGYISDSISKDDTVQRFCDNFGDKINTTEYNYGSDLRQCVLTTPDGIEWIIKPRFYESGYLLTDEDKKSSQEYSTHFIVKVPKGESFIIYMRYDGKLAVKDANVIEILKDASKLK